MNLDDWHAPICRSLALTKEQMKERRGEKIIAQKGDSQGGVVGSLPLREKKRRGCFTMDLYSS